MISNRIAAAARNQQQDRQDQGGLTEQGSVKSVASLGQDGQDYRTNVVRRLAIIDHRGTLAGTLGAWETL